MLRIVLAATALLAACGNGEAGSSSAHTIRGTMDLVEPQALLDRYLAPLADADGEYDKVDCSEGLPGVGYSDIHSGAQVNVANESGTTIATAILGAGRLFREGGPDDKMSCRFPFSVSVPKATFYKVSIGRRGEITSSFEEMVADNWRVEVALGDPG